MSSKKVANEIIVNVYDRDRTDIMVEPALVTVVLASYLLFTISYAVTQMSRIRDLTDNGVLAMHVATFLTLGLLIMMSIFFLLMSRNEKHSHREKALRKAMIDYLQELNHLRGSNLDGLIAEMRRIDDRISSKERPAAARKWGLIIVAPLVLMVISSFTDTAPLAVPVLGLALGTSFVALVFTIRGVTNFAYNHEKAWLDFLTPFQKSLKELQIPFPNKFEKQVGFRSFLVFLILSLVTGWLFMPIWAYLLFRDMNLHFRQQWAWENCLIRALRNFEAARGGLMMERVQDYDISL
ncbi:MAG: hypothetical protein PHW93_02005 [Candidatus Methanomethylophilaceae archaeon]|nr:hypothetical protein [Candidatus Methanomethylophilaceae archaeon]